MMPHTGPSEPDARILASPESLVFGQLLAWFSSRGSELKQFSRLSLVGPRRNDMKSLLCRKRGCRSKRVLKTFGRLADALTAELVVYELLVPLVVGHAALLSTESVFVHDEVPRAKLRHSTSSTNFKRAATCATCWISSSIETQS